MKTRHYAGSFTKSKSMAHLGRRCDPTAHSPRKHKRRCLFVAAHKCRPGPSWKNPQSIKSSSEMRVESSYVDGKLCWRVMPANEARAPPMEAPVVTMLYPGWAASWERRTDDNSSSTPFHLWRNNQIGILLRDLASVNGIYAFRNPWCTSVPSLEKIQCQEYVVVMIRTLHGQDVLGGLIPSTSKSVRKKVKSVIIPFRPLLDKTKRINPISIPTNKTGV